MKAIDAKFVSKALGNIKTLLSDLANDERLKDEDKLRTLLENTRDRLKGIKEELDEEEVKVRIRKRRKKPETQKT